VLIMQASTVYVTVTVTAQAGQATEVASGGANVAPAPASAPSPAPSAPALVPALNHPRTPQAAAVPVLPPMMRATMMMRTW
jgi:hypothetical protein